MVVGFQPPILAFGITYPAMLGWLAVASAPILIHLWNRRRYRETSWAAMDYLLAAIRQSRRRLRLRQWLLLAIRMLIVVLVVLAVSEPYRRHGALLFSPGGARTHRVLVVDDSFSMAHRAGERSRFEQAKALAKEIVDQCPPGDGFSLVRMGQPARAVVATPSLEPRDFANEIDALEQGQASADLAQTLAVVDQLLQTSRRQQPGLEREEVIFLTDLCRVGWTVPRAAADATTKLAQRLGRHASLIVIDLGQPGAENQAIAQLRLRESPATTAEPARIDAVVSNFGRQTQKGRQVNLLVDGHLTHRTEVDLPAGGSAAVAFSHRFDTPGYHTIEARLQADTLPIDNQRWLALRVKTSIDVLCVDGHHAGGEFGGAAGYLRLALAPRAGELAAQRVRPHVVTESALIETDLARYDAVFLCDVAQLTASEAQALTGYVRVGGALVFFLGDRVKTEQYNHRLGGPEGLLPGALGDVVHLSAPGVDPLEYRHPIVEPFRGREQAGLLTTPIDRIVSLDVAADSTARVALATASGQPLVVERPFGRGRVVLVTTSADTSWTAMPLWPSYVPLVQQILAYAIGQRDAQRNVLVGQALAAALPPGAAGVAGEVHMPNGRAEPLPAHTEADAALWTFDDTTAAGIYTVQFGDASGHEESMAVNVDTIESDLEKLSEEQLRAEVLPGATLDYQTTWHATDMSTPSRIGHRATLGRPLLYAVLALLFVETFVAWRFGAT